MEVLGQEELAGSQGKVLRSEEPQLQVQLVGCTDEPSKG